MKKELVFAGSFCIIWYGFWTVFPFDKREKLTYNILNKTASKGGQGSPPWWISFKLRNSCLLFSREQGGYFLCVRFRIATISMATPKMIWNSSYVLISIPSCARLRTGNRSRPTGCPGKYMILSWRRPLRSAEADFYSTKDQKYRFLSLSNR